MPPLALSLFFSLTRTEQKLHRSGAVCFQNKGFIFFEAHADTHTRTHTHERARLNDLFHLSQHLVAAVVERKRCRKPLQAEFVFVCVRARSHLCARAHVSKRDTIQHLLFTQTQITSQRLERVAGRQQTKSHALLCDVKVWTRFLHSANQLTAPVSANPRNPLVSHGLEK